MRRADRDAAFSDFVASRQAHLRRVAYALCGDWHTADDLVQTALVKLYVAWPRVERRGTEEAYARQILVRSNIDRFRRASRREQATATLPEHPGPDDMAAHDDRQGLFAALQSLPEMQRKVVVLRHWLGLSVAETAAELGIGEGTVKSHSSRGIKALQGVLAPR